MANFKGGDKLKQRLAEMVGKFDKGEVLRVGYLSRSTYPDGKPVALIALFNDFGTKNSPPRPFFRNMIAKHKDEWPGEMLTLLKRYKNPEAVLTLMGERIVDELRQSIMDTNTPKLSDATIKRKGHAKPLIDSRKMYDSGDYEIVKR